MVIIDDDGVMHKVFTKADMVAMLTDLQLEIEESPCKHPERLGDYSDGIQKGIDIIQQKIVDIVHLNEKEKEK